MTKLIQIVDENDQPIGESEMVAAWKKGLNHRIVRVMIEDQSRLILLQKRAATSKIYQNCWDHSASGHVDAGESYDQAAAREAAEEIGLHELRLREIGRYRSHDTYKNFKLNRFNRVYKAIVPANIALKLQISEVSDAKWFTVADIKKLIKDHPDKVTDGLVEVFERYY